MAGLQSWSKTQAFQNGKYSTHFDKAVNLAEDAVEYTVNVPLFRRSDCSRATTPIMCAPANDIAYDAHISNGPSIRGQLATMDMPRAFTSHAITRECAETGAFAWPFAIYLDGVEIAREDTCLGIWFVDLVTQRRWGLAVLRKNELCHCGCQG